MSKDISFGSFNLYNLQLPDKQWRLGKKYTQKQYDAKIESAAALLALMQADVIGFQELWSPECLHDLFNAAGLDQEYELRFIDDKWYDIAVAIAVRKPWAVKKVVVHKAFPKECVLRKRRATTGVDREDDDVQVKIDHFSRSVLEVDVEKAGVPGLPRVKVFAAHLKSKLATRLDKEELSRASVKPHAVALGEAISTIRRTAEAAALRVLLNKVTKGDDKPVVCLGDLNDGLLSNTLNILTAQPTFRVRAKSTAGQSDAGLYSTAMLAQLGSFRDVYYSHEHKGSLEILDHVLVSEQFYDHSKKRVWSMDRFKIWNDHVGDDDNATTDHGVALAGFKYNPAK